MEDNLHYSMTAADFMASSVSEVDLLDMTSSEFHSDSLKSLGHSQLTHSKTMSEVYARNGVAEGDHINHIDQMMMYNELKASQEKAMKEYIANANYGAAAELRDRIKRLEQEVGNLQRKQRRNQQQKEHRALQQASQIIKVKTNQYWAAEKRRDDEEYHDSKRDMHKAHAVITKNLEDEIAHFPPKIFKASTSLLDLRNSEKSLCEGLRFEEAMVVKTRADRQDRRERSEFERGVRAEKEKKRTDNRNWQRKKVKEHDSLEKGLEWNHRRCVHCT
jgi:hypothetical protein